MCVYVSADQQGVEHKYSSKHVGGTHVKGFVLICVMQIFASIFCSNDNNNPTTHQ